MDAITVLPRAQLGEWRQLVGITITTRLLCRSFNDFKSSKMQSQLEKGSQAKRKPSSQPTLISNYFKKIDSPVEKRQSTVPAKRNGAAGPNTEVDPTEEAEGQPAAKRARLETPPSDDSSENVTPAREANALTALMSPKVKEFRPPPESPQTARYKYMPTSPAKDDENITPEQIARRKSLHEKFVAKLGTPDSIASVRRPSNNDTAVEGDEEEEHQEEEEDEEAPAVKELRGRYAAKGGKKAISSTKAKGESTTKFTPLERQFVELKKQYPDTLLLIEVGYKFRFFGDDAKVCVLEIPY